MNPFEKFPPHITRDEIMNTKETHFYIYADDRTSKSIRGQAETAFGLENTGKIITKWWKCTATESYFHDGQFEVLTKLMIDNCVRDILESYKGRTIVVFPKIGCGMAELPQRAPRTLKYIQEQLAKLLKLNNKTK